MVSTWEPHNITLMNRPNLSRNWTAKLVALQDWKVKALRAHQKTTLAVFLFTSAKKTVIDTYPTGSEHNGQATEIYMELYMQDARDWIDDANADIKLIGSYCTDDAGHAKLPQPKLRQPIDAQTFQCAKLPQPKLRQSTDVQRSQHTMRATQVRCALVRAYVEIL
jgi:hypothetical protein